MPAVAATFLVGQSTFVTVYIIITVLCRTEIDEDFLTFKFRNCSLYFAFNITDFEMLSQAKDCLYLLTDPKNTIPTDPAYPKDKDGFNNVKIDCQKRLTIDKKTTTCLMECLLSFRIIYQNTINVFFYGSLKCNELREIFNFLTTDSFKSVHVDFINTSKACDTSLKGIINCIQNIITII